MKIVTRRLNEIVNDRLTHTNIERVGRNLGGEGAHARGFRFARFALRAAALAVLISFFW